MAETETEKAKREAQEKKEAAKAAKKRNRELKRVKKKKEKETAKKAAYDSGYTGHIILLNTKQQGGRTWTKIRAGYYSSGLGDESVVIRREGSRWLVITWRGEESEHATLRDAKQAVEDRDQLRRASVGENGR